jgi:hypothetical protein
MALKNPRKFLRGLREVYQSNMRNPSVSGSVTSEARLRDAVGSDALKNRKLSGPATPFGMTWVKTRQEPKDY